MVLNQIHKKLAPIIFVIDTSAGMAEESIVAVNEAMNSLIAEMNSRNDDFFRDNDVAIGILSYSNYARWITNGLENIEDYCWQELIAHGLSNLGTALDQLGIKLSRHALLNCPNGVRVPTIFFIVGGDSTDSYKESLEKLRNNKWFQVSRKICINYNLADDKIVRSLVDREDDVLYTKTTVGLKNMIINEFPKYLKEVVIGSRNPFAEPKEYIDELGRLRAHNSESTSTYEPSDSEDLWVEFDDEDGFI